MKRLAQDTTCVVDDPDRDLRPPFVVSLHHALSQDSAESSSSVVRFCGDAKFEKLSSKSLNQSSN